MTTLLRFLDLAIIFALLMAWAIIVERIVERLRPQPADWPPPVVLMVSPGLRDWLRDNISWPPPDPSTRVA